MRHPVLTALVKTRIRQDLRRQGTGLIEAIHLANLASDEIIDEAQNQLPPEAFEAVTALSGPVTAGEGGLIDRIIKFLDSDLGKMLVALVKRLIGV